MFSHPDPEVLVVGAGPVGLVAALFLQQHGVRVEIVDTHQRTTQHSYALAIHPRTLRILDEAGLSEGLIGAGRKLTKVAYYEGRERRAEIDYSALASKHPYLLVLRQSLLERAAEEALRRQKLKVLWGHRLQSLTVDGATLRAEVAKLDQVATGYPVARSEWVVVAKRDDPTVLCHRRRRVRLGRAADGRHRDGRAWRRPGLLRLRDRGGRGASRGSARHSRSGPDERLLAPRGGAMPLGIPDPGRLGTRGIDGAARAADRREGSLVHGAADRRSTGRRSASSSRAWREASAREASGSPGTPRTRRLRSACTA